MVVKRVYVPESMHDALVDALATRARAIKVGNGLDDGVEMGPINNRVQFARVTGLVADALDHGAHAVTGGAPLDGPGYFYAPTILTGVAEGTRIVDEEQFGPALPIMPYQSVEEAIERANASTYGLGSSVWSNDQARAHAVAEQLESGTTWINTHAVLGHEQPFLGRKWSGLGASNGLYSISAFSDMQTIYEARS